MITAAPAENGGSSPPLSVADLNVKNGGSVPNKNEGSRTSSQPDDDTVGPNDIIYSSHNPEVPLPNKFEHIILDDLQNIVNITTSLREMPLEDLLHMLHLPADSPQSESDNKASQLKMLLIMSQDGF